MRDILAGIPGVVVLQNDVLVCGQDNATYNKRLITVLYKLYLAGLKIRHDKCSFRANSVVFLGYRVDTAGIHPLKDKRDIIRNFPE